MKKVLTSVCGGAALLVLLTGCDPYLAEIESGSQEELWYKQLKANYPSFTPPRNPAPAVYNRSVPVSDTPAASSVPADDPEKTVDRAAEGENITPLQEPAKDPDSSGKEKSKDAPGTEVKNTPKAASAGADPAAESAPTRFYTVKAGDTLGSIAKHFYGKASMEDILFRANTKVLKNRHQLRIGMRLVIPEL